MKKYKTILADLPWNYEVMGKRHSGKSPRRLPSDYYNCMTMDELKALQVEKYAEDNAHMYLWVTNAFIEEGHQLMRAWGFNTKTMITWVKDRMGLGWYFKGQTEHMLFGVRGSLLVKDRSVSTVFNAKRLEHSRKPEASYELIEKQSPPHYLELFARQLNPMFPKRKGWDVWGNEVESDINLKEIRV